MKVGGVAKLDLGGIRELEEVEELAEEAGQRERSILFPHKEVKIAISNGMSTFTPLANKISNKINI
jgi:hypothetical protein